VVMEGVSMYLTSDELRSFAENLSSRFTRIAWLADCYTVKAAKLSKIKNPVNDVGVTEVYGIDDPTLLQTGGFTFIKEHEMTPQRYIDELHGAEKIIFQKLYAGSVAKKLYRMFEYRKQG